MLKNKGKGGKNRRRRKNKADDDNRELVFKEDGQVTRMLGNGRCQAQCIDGTKRLCHIVLVGLRDYQDDKLGVIL